MARTLTLASTPSPRRATFRPTSCTARSWRSASLRPSYVQLSSDHTHPRWRFQSHHRLKNVIVVMEWSPVSSSCAQAPAAAAGLARPPASGAFAVAALTDGQRSRLSRVFQMYDAEGRGALSEERLRRVLSDMGLEPDVEPSEKAALEQLLSSLRASGSANVDPTSGALRVPAFEFLRVMQAQEFLTGESGRYWVAPRCARRRAARRDACSPRCAAAAATAARPLSG